MGEEHGRADLFARCHCDESSAAAGRNLCGRPPRADEGNADGSGATFQEGIPCDRSFTSDSTATVRWSDDDTHGLDSRRDVHLQDPGGSERKDTDLAVALQVRRADIPGIGDVPLKSEHL